MRYIILYIHHESLLHYGKYNIGIFVRLTFNIICIYLERGRRIGFDMIQEIKLDHKSIDRHCVENYVSVCDH